MLAEAMRKTLHKKGYASKVVHRDLAKYCLVMKRASVAGFTKLAGSELRRLKPWPRCELDKLSSAIRSVPRPAIRRADSHRRDHGLIF